VDHKKKRPLNPASKNQRFCAKKRASGTAQNWDCKNSFYAKYNNPPSNILIHKAALMLSYFPLPVGNIIPVLPNYREHPSS
jgi:hypothetical protein